MVLENLVIPFQINNKIKVVDGGISKENIVEVSRAGADTFVAGSAIFNTKDYKDTISNLKSLID